MSVTQYTVESRRRFICNAAASASAFMLFSRRLRRSCTVWTSESADSRTALLNVELIHRTNSIVWLHKIAASLFAALVSQAARRVSVSVCVDVALHDHACLARYRAAASVKTSAKSSRCNVKPRLLLEPACLCSLLCVCPALPFARSLVLAVTCAFVCG